MLAVVCVTFEAVSILYDSPCPDSWCNARKEVDKRQVESKYNFFAIVLFLLKKCHWPVKTSYVPGSCFLSLLMSPCALLPSCEGQRPPGLIYRPPPPSVGAPPPLLNGYSMCWRTHLGGAALTGSDRPQVRGSRGPQDLCPFRVSQQQCTEPHAGLRSRSTQSVLTVELHSLCHAVCHGRIDLKSFFEGLWVIF